MSLQIKGTVKRVLPKFEKGNFKSTPVIIETDGQYPQPIQLEFIGEKSDDADKFKGGETINAHFNLKGNEHEGKVYNKLQVWKWEAI